MNLKSVMYLRKNLIDLENELQPLLWTKGNMETFGSKGKEMLEIKMKIRDLQVAIDDMKDAICNCLTYPEVEKEYDELNYRITEYDMLKASVHNDIEKVWQLDHAVAIGEEIDTSVPMEIKDRVFYKIANGWIEE